MSAVVELTVPSMPAILHGKRSDPLVGHVERLTDVVRGLAEELAECHGHVLGLRAQVDALAGAVDATAKCVELTATSVDRSIRHAVPDLVEGVLRARELTEKAHREDLRAQRAQSMRARVRQIVVEWVLRAMLVASGAALMHAWHILWR